MLAYTRVSRDRNGDNGDDSNNQKGKASWDEEKSERVKEK